MNKFFIFLIFLFSTSLFANLIEEVDKLSPEEAKLLVQKLDAKFFHPIIPESFFTRFTASTSFGINYSYPKEFNNYLDNAHDNFNKFAYGQLNLMWFMSKKFMLGLMVDGKNFESKETLEAGKYQKASLTGLTLALASTYNFDISERWLFSPSIGIGPFIAFASFVTDDDNLKTTYDYSFSGIGYSGVLTLPFLYRINKVFAIGPELSYQYARVDKLKRYDTTINNPKNITFNGFGAGLKIAYNY